MDDLLDDEELLLDDDDDDDDNLLVELPVTLHREGIAIRYNPCIFFVTLIVHSLLPPPPFSMLLLEDIFCENDTCICSFIPNSPMFGFMDR